MEYRSSEIKAGLFIFVSLIVLVIMVVTLGNLKDSFRDKKQVRILFNYTGGLSVGAPVRYAGLEVGKVSDILLVDGGEKGRDRVEVIADIEPSIKLKINSNATINTAGLMGGLYIDIRPGSMKSPGLKPGEPLVGRDSFEFAQVGDIMNQFLSQVERFTDLSGHLISDSRETLKSVQESLILVNEFVHSNEQELHASLVNARTISNNLVRLLDRKNGKISLALRHINSITGKTDRLLTGKEQDLNDIIEQTQQFTREMELLMADNRPGITNLVRTMETDSRKIVDKLDTVGVNLNQTLEQSNAILLENRRNFLELIKNLKETAASLKYFAEDIKRNPWKLVRKGEERPAPEKDTLKPVKPGDPVRMKRLDKIAAD